MKWENSWYDIDMYGNEVDPYYEPEEGAKNPDEY
jgi:hypothetical protein